MVVNDDTQAALDWVKLTMAFYIGGMGAKDKNFHLDVVSRFGYEEEAHKVQELFLAGDRDGAVKAVPDELCDGIALCGPLDADQGAARAVAGVTGHHPAPRRGQRPGHHARPRRHDPLTHDQQNPHTYCRRSAPIRILLIMEGWGR